MMPTEGTAAAERTRIKEMQYEMQNAVSQFPKRFSHVLDNAIETALFWIDRAEEAEAELKSKGHVRDEDCVLDEDGICLVCKVDHGGPPCPECSGRAFHHVTCPRLKVAKQY